MTPPLDPAESAVAMLIGALAGATDADPLSLLTPTAREKWEAPGVLQGKRERLAPLLAHAIVVPRVQQPPTPFLMHIAQLLAIPSAQWEPREGRFVLVLPPSLVGQAPSDYHVWLYAVAVTLAQPSADGVWRIVSADTIPPAIAAPQAN
jgi:hypothetical protein